MPSSWPAFKMLTYITSASMKKSEKSDGYQVLILYFDNREKILTFVKERRASGNRTIHTV